MDQNWKNEIGGECSMYSGEGECVQGFSGLNLKEKDHLEDIGKDGGHNIKMCL
jgi:hypothetical protein